MIGSDEFNLRSAQPVAYTTGDISEMEYIESFVGSKQDDSQLLIDIVCPQPQSRRRNIIPAASRPSITRSARTNSSSSWGK